MVGTVAAATAADELAVGRAASASADGDARVQVLGSEAASRPFMWPWRLGRFSFTSEWAKFIQYRYRSFFTERDSSLPSLHSARLHYFIYLVILEKKK